MALRDAYNEGCTAAFARFKLSNVVMGSSYGVMPRGTEMAHGTDRFQYPLRPRATSDAGDPLERARAESATDFLWGLAKYDNHAPDNVSGFGTETIG